YFSRGAKTFRPVSEATLTESLTDTRALAGTLPYMAPEQLRGRPADARERHLGARRRALRDGHRGTALPGTDRVRTERSHSESIATSASDKSPRQVGGGHRALSGEATVRALSTGMRSAGRSGNDPNGRGVPVGRAAPYAGAAARIAGRCCAGRSGDCGCGTEYCGAGGPAAVQ